jgi:hypothetical protein
MVLRGHLTKARAAVPGLQTLGRVSMLPGQAWLCCQRPGGLLRSIHQSVLQRTGWVAGRSIHSNRSRGRAPPRDRTGQDRKPMIETLGSCGWAASLSELWLRDANGRMVTTPARGIPYTVAVI